MSLGLVVSSYAADEQALDEGGDAAVSDRVPAKHASKGGIKIKVDDVRVEWGPFTNDNAPDSDALLHGAISAKARSGDWELMLGARFDGYEQSGSPGFTKTKLDYTENYLRWRGEDTLITLGAQNILWGRVDEISPIDRMSRADYSRAILDKLPQRRRAVPAVRLERFVGDYKIDAVWLPLFDAAVMPDKESVWHPVDRSGERILGIGKLPGLAGVRLREDEHGSGGGGVRLTHTGDRIDYGLSLQRVRQSLPYYRIAPGALTEVHPFSWVLGGELEAQAAGATWRMEAAWNSDVPLTTRAFQYRTEQAFDLVLGTEFFPGDGETRFTLQVYGHKTFADVPILDRSEFYGFTGEIEHPFLQGRWRANVRLLAGIGDNDWYLNPKITYLGFDRHEIYLAAHLFAGSEQTVGGYYESNDLVVLGWQAKF